MIDTHAHVNFNDFKNDSNETIKRSLKDGIWVINVGAEKATSEMAVKMAEGYEEGVFAAVGLHPSHLMEQNVEYQENGEPVKYKSNEEEFNYDFYLELAKHEKVVAIGECGLDYFRVTDQNFKEKQKEIFAKHIELAKEVNKPLIIHCRDARPPSLRSGVSGQAHDDLFKILHLEAKLSSGVMHFFTGTADQAKKYIDLGFYISFSGVITFAKEYEETVRQIPLEKILTETDCPYVAPAPHRGKRNEPAYVKYVAQKIAEIKGLSFDEVAEQTTKNARELFGI